MTRLTHGDAQDLLDTFKRGWETRDPDTVLALFSPEAEYREHPFGPPLVGSNAIRARWNEIAATQAHVDFEPEMIWVAGAAVLASWHAAYTRRAAGERVRVRGFMTMELDDDGAIRRFRQWPLEQVVGVDSTFRPEGEGS
jgi:ketosteroid isomerase-like protein